MKPATEKRRTTRIWFYAGVLILVFCVWRVQVYMYDNKFPESAKVFSQSDTSSAPTDWQKMLVQAMSDANGLLTTLATAMLGALGLLLVRKMQAVSEPRHMWAAVLGATSAGLSLYCGYACHLNLLWMITSQTFEASDSWYQFFSQAQFYTLLAGAFFLADFAVHDLNPE